MFTHHSLRGLTIGIPLMLLGLAGGSTAAAQLQVDVVFAPSGGNFAYDVFVTNNGGVDVSVVTLTDAPLNDALISSTLIAPSGLIASYEPVFGFVDFVENTQLFAAGETRGAFSFESSSAPITNFTAFQAITTDGLFITGATNVVPEPATGAASLALLTAVIRRRRS